MLKNCLSASEKTSENGGDRKIKRQRIRILGGMIGYHEGEGTEGAIDNIAAEINEYLRAGGSTEELEGLVKEGKY